MHDGIVHLMHMHHLCEARPHRAFSMFAVLSVNASTSDHDRDRQNKNVAAIAKDWLHLAIRLADAKCFSGYVYTPRVPSIPVWWASNPDDVTQCLTCDRAPSLQQTS